MLRQLLRRFRKKEEERISGFPVDLVVEKQVQPGQYEATAYTVWYGIYLHDTDIRIGFTDLRVGKNDELYYAGNIGYQIYPRYRGHSYAYEASKLLLHTAREEFGMDELIITCSPDNPASRRTIEKLGGELIETADVPAWHWLYRRGETVKRIYRFDLSGV